MAGVLWPTAGGVDRSSVDGEKGGDESPAQLPTLTRGLREQEAEGESKELDEHPESEWESWSQGRSRKESGSLKSVLARESVRVASSAVQLTEVNVCEQSFQ